MTTEQILERERGKGHGTVTTVTCKVQQWDRYRVQRILVKVKFESRPVLMSKYHDSLLFMVLYREALDRLCVRLNMYLVFVITSSNFHQLWQFLAQRWQID